MIKMINSFSPTEREKYLMSRIKKDRIYKYRCWLPESIMMIGDTFIYFDDLEDFDDNEAYLVKAIEENPYWIEDVETEEHIYQKGGRLYGKEFTWSSL